VESTGPDVKVRGSAQQVLDKYLSLAQDAISSGDRVAAEGYFQYADHYYRMVNGGDGGSNGQGRPDHRHRKSGAPTPALAPTPQPAPVSTATPAAAPAPAPVKPRTEPFKTVADDESTKSKSPPKTEPETSPA
jgi:hypothetical protein